MCSFRNHGRVSKVRYGKNTFHNVRNLQSRKNFTNDPSKDALSSDMYVSLGK